MDQEQKERLEQELRFLKESLEADVISKDEYERGKERIERKLRDVEEEPKVEEVKEEPEIEIKEIKEKPTKIIGAEEEIRPEEPEEEPEVEEEKAEERKEEEPEEEIKISKKWLYAIAIIIITVILFFSIRSWIPTKETPAEEQIEETPIIEEFTPECSLDSDCKQEGMLGICLNPGTKEAKCEFTQDIQTNLVIINDKNCELCDPSNTKTIVKQIFPNVNIKDIDYKTEEAKELIHKLNINALPSYIFDLDVDKTINFNDFKSALIKKEENYIITNTASGANYYFKRPLIENKLDLYVLPETTEKIEANVQEVLDLLDEIELTKHMVTEAQKEALEKELGINTYPAFLLNNQVKFKGVLPADLIKENICKVNHFEECSEELSKI